MTELENILTNALEKLSTQYEMEMTKIEKQINSLSNQVSDLSKQNETLISHYNQVAQLLKEELEK